MKAKEWTAEALEAQLNEEMGPHRKGELMAPELARLLSLLWEAHRLDLERIDSLRARVADLETVTRTAGSAGKEE